MYKYESRQRYNRINWNILLDLQHMCDKLLLQTSQKIIPAFLSFKREQSVLKPDIQGLLNKLFCFWWHFRPSNYCLLILPVQLLWPDRAIMMRTDGWDEVWHCTASFICYFAKNKLLNHAEMWLKTKETVNQPISLKEKILISKWLQVILLWLVIRNVPHVQHIDYNMQETENTFS